MAHVEHIDHLPLSHKCSMRRTLCRETEALNRSAAGPKVKKLSGRAGVGDCGTAEPGMLGAGCGARPFCADLARKGGVAGAGPADFVGNVGVAGTVAILGVKGAVPSLRSINMNVMP